jgi:hypothetical protein
MFYGVWCDVIFRRGRPPSDAPCEICYTHARITKERRPAAQKHLTEERGGGGISYNTYFVHMYVYIPEDMNGRFITKIQDA